MTIKDLIRASLKEDLGSGDITSNSIIHKRQKIRAAIVAKQNLIVAGVNLAAEVFKTVNGKIRVKVVAKDGSLVKSGAVIAKIEGPARDILSAERTALNFLQHMSGIATLTRKFIATVRGTKTKILDTRKTTPGHRILEKYAVLMGGGTNHRTGLYDMYLIKNNHIDIAGSVIEAILAAQKANRRKLPIEVEVRNMEELMDAVTFGADLIMLDNFSPKNTKKALKMVQILSKITKKCPKIEISGGISLKNIKKYAKMGVDYISIGQITHSAPASDFHMIIIK